MSSDQLRPGWTPASRQTFSPLNTGGQFANSFQGQPSSQAPGGDSGEPERAGPHGASQPAQAPAQPALTFAQMQAQGQARPPAPQAPQSPLQGQVEGALSQRLARPSGYGSEAVQRSFQNLSGQIDDDFELRGRATDEKFAKRGLYDSSAAAGATYDLNVGRRSAKMQLGENLLDRQAQTEGQDSNSAIMAALGYTGQSGNLGLGYANLGQQGRQFGQQLGFQYANLGQQGEQYDKGLGFQYANLGQQGAQYDKGLGFQYANLGQQGEQYDKGLGFQYANLGQQGAQYDKSLGFQYANLGQQNDQFGRTLGQNNDQFGRNLGEQGRQFDGNLGFNRDQMAQTGRLTENQQYINMMNVLNGTNLAPPQGGVDRNGNPLTEPINSQFDNRR